MSEQILQDQIAYYRQRAGEYDGTAYEDLDAARIRIDRIVASLPSAPRTLELACGTGMWTESLARRDTLLTALDAAPEALSVARRRCPNRVEFVCADVFEWKPKERFDLIFFAFWLSHVPSLLVGSFFDRLSGPAAPGGRVVFVDEHVSQAAHDVALTEDPEATRRRLADGSVHRLVKVYLEPHKITETLTRLGWDAQVSRDRTDWIIGSCRRT